ncbi:AbrB/MazE/SpoVT family DNA-binding domain-containing protein [Candidatus Micrarchaeota archaeon]|nr:AbrB/MazE/SpoVT family DNA-binding domain-containing protein [Candidatus Micrarchaeota archaeon]
MAQIATLSERGQVVIPLQVREKMGLEAGSKFAVFPVNDSIVLKRMEIPSLDQWDTALNPLRHEAGRKKVSERGISRMVAKSRRRK